MKPLTNGTSTSRFEPENNPMKTLKKHINVELQYQRDTFDIERLVEATRILMEVLGQEVDSEGDCHRSS